MDFDPSHPRWHCCGCHLRHGLMVLSALETVASLVVLLLSIITAAVPNSKEPNSIPWFVIMLILFSFVYGQSSACLFFGAYKYKEHLMYPTLTVRAAVFVFSYAIGFSILIQALRVISKAGTYFIKLFLLIMIVLFLISVFLFHTMYLVAQCIQYVKIYKELCRIHSNFSLQIRLNRAASCIPLSPIINRADQESIDECTCNQRSLSF
uniref:DUF7027 domain-containing protein n=1 Tax=Onchocerca volvulus TaxID=6282 RepID=A0A8R1XQH8_ONCVO